MGIATPALKTNEEPPRGNREHAGNRKKTHERHVLDTHLCVCILFSFSKCDGTAAGRAAGKMLSARFVLTASCQVTPLA